MQSHIESMEKIMCCLLSLYIFLLTVYFLGFVQFDPSNPLEKRPKIRRSVHSRVLSPAERWIQMKDGINKQRLKRIQKVCNKYQGQLSYKPREPFSYLSSVSRNIAACRIPKDATSSVYSIFQSFDKDFMKLRPSQVNDSFIKFVMVREPLERLVSAYINKVYQPDFPEKVKILQQRVNQQLNSSEANISFSQFINYIVLGDNDEFGGGFDAHWTPAWRICQICSRKFDYILHLEPPNEDFQYLFYKLGLDPESSMTWRHAAFTSTISNQFDEEKLKKLSTYYHEIDRPTLLRVYQKFKIDYELFGYDFNNVLRMAGEQALSKEEKDLPPWFYND